MSSNKSWWSRINTLAERIWFRQTNAEEAGANFSRYERVYGQNPRRVVARHPSGHYVAMEYYYQQEWNVAVWEEETGKVAWTQERTKNLCWLKQGTEVALLTKRTAYGRLGAPYEQDIFERRTWPGNTLISSCRVTWAWGWPDSIVVSPYDNLAAIRYLDEGISGWEFVIISDTGDYQLRGAGVETIGNQPAIHTFPGFSPDGRCAVSGYHTKFVENKLGYLAPLERNSFEIGYIMVICILEATYYAIPIRDAVPAKLAEDDLDDADETIAPTQSVFLDNEHFTTTFPTGEKRTYHVKGYLP